MQLFLLSPSSRRGSAALRLVLALAGVGLVAGGAWYLLSQGELTAPSDSAEEVQASVETEPRETEPTMDTAPAGRPSPRVASTALPSGPVLTPSDPVSRQLVGAVVDFPYHGAEFTPEQAAQWRQNLKNLVRHGPAAVGAIREYLARNTDALFGSPGTNNIGYATARAAMFDALARIGGPEATDILRDHVRNSGNPAEIAWAAQNLVALSAENKAETLDAVRHALARADAGEIAGADVAPLFEVLQKYGDASVIPDLLQHGKSWNYYAIAALARLPDGAGMSTLAQIADAQVPLGLNARSAAYQMLAQSALDSPVAKAGLLEQVRAGSITSQQWSQITPLLAGDQLRFANSAFDYPSRSIDANDLRATRIGDGNQSFYTAPAPETLTPERLKQHAALVDELLAATSDPESREALQSAKGMIERRLTIGFRADPATGGP